MPRFLRVAGLEGSSGSRIPFAVLLAGECNVQLPAFVQFAATQLELFPTDMAEVVRIISGVVRKTKRFAEGLTLFLCGTPAGLLVRRSETPPVSLGGITVVP